MLADKLLQLENSKEPKRCMLGVFMKNLDEETLEVFERIMKNPEVSAAKILPHIRQSGYNGGITHLREKRRECFSGEECPCIKEAKNG
jgi:hypothetical protein